MAAKEIKLSKGEELYDAGRRHVLAEKIQPLPENLKKKISIILEAIPARSKSEIAEVLQACDYRVDKALNYFIAGGMEAQNEWMVQGKRKNKKKKKPGKKATKDSTENQPQESSQTNLKSEPGPSCSAQGSKESEKEKEACQAVLNPMPNGVLPQQHEDKKITIEKDAATDQVKPLVNGELKAVEATLFETISPPLLSPTESLKSSPDPPSSTKGKPSHHSPLEKHPRVRTQSTSGPEVIRKSLKDLQRSSVSIARFQSMFDAEGESSTKILAKSFQVMRQALDEREKLLEEQLQSVIEETKKLLDERQQDAAGLKFKCNRVGTMTEDETTELRNQIKHFVGERRIDEDLGKTIRFVRDEEKMMEAIKSFGEVTPIKHQYTTYKRKQPDPVEKKSHPLKPPPLKTTHLPSGPSPTADTKKNNKPESANETRGSNSRSNKQQPVLSPSRLKDQAEMHARLQEALKQQVGSIPKDSKQGERPGNEKQKPNGGRSRFYSAKQQYESRRQHTPQQHRQEQTKNSTQNSSKSPNKNGVGSSSNEKAKTQEEKPTGSNPTEDATTREEKKENPRGGNKEKPGSGHVNPQPGSRRTRRRYIKRNTPLGSGDFSNNFTNSNVHEKKLKDENSLKEPGSKQGSTSEDFSKEPCNQGSTTERLSKEPGNKVSLSEGSSKEPGNKGCSSEGSSKEPGNKGSFSEGPSKGPGNKGSTSESLLKKTGNKGSLSDGSSKEPGNKGSSSEGSSKEPGNKESTNESLSKEPGNKGSTSADYATESKEGQNIIVNGTNGFAPLPQRNPRGRKIYYKRNPETEVEFPPPKENGSVGNNSASRQSTVA